MANKFHDNLIVSSSPHIVTESDTTRLMGSVLLALAPAWIASIYIFGLRALLLSVVCVAASVLFEYLFNVITHKKQTVGDLSGHKLRTLLRDFQELGETASPGRAEISVTFPVQCPRLTPGLESPPWHMALPSALGRVAACSNTFLVVS